MENIEEIIVHSTPTSAWTSIPPDVTSAYSNIAAHDHSRIHNGHVYHFHQHYTVRSHQDEFLESSSQATLKRKRSLLDVEKAPRTREAQESLDTVLKKLGKLSLSFQHRKEGDGAEKLARRISAIFDAITTHGDESTWDKVDSRRLGKLRSTVRWEERFDINSVPRRDILARNLRAKQRRIVVQIGQWNISLTTTVLGTRRGSDLHEVDTYSALRVEPQYQSSGPALAVFFSEQRDDDCTSSIPPALLVYNMVGSFAEVFRFIEDDDLRGLQNLLARGKASIHDCDESGRSLLHYACHMNSPDCCSFLVGCSVDIDRFELGFEGADTPGVTFGYVSLLQSSTALAIASDVGSCFDILWHAGADPTVTANPENALPPLRQILKSKLPSYVAAPLLHRCLEKGSPYIDFQDRSEFSEGRGYWLEFCSGTAILEDPTLMQALIEKGVDITETDENGFNCLFMFMSRTNWPQTGQELEALRCLLDVFNDIHALDAMGNDVFAYVNEVQDWPGTYTDPLSHMFVCGSYKQDLWYCALARSKLHDRHNVQPCNRLARYTECYTPKHYVALCHLDEWDDVDKERFEGQLQPALHKYPLSEEEERIQNKIETPWRWES